MLLFLGSFSIIWLRLAIIEPENRFIHLLIFVLFAFICCVLGVIRRKSLPCITLQYIFQDDKFQNCGKFSDACADVQYPLFVSQTYIAATNGMPYREKFYLISNTPLQYVPNHEGNGMRVVHHLAKSGCVILPINAVTQAIVEQLAKNGEIPMYPQIAYIQR